MTVDEALRSGQLGLLEAALSRVCFEATAPGAAGQNALSTLRLFQQNLLSASRKSALSALFFEANPDQLARSIDHYCHFPAGSAMPLPKIIIAPHAGHIYSGATAGKAYALLAAHASQIRRIVLLGPAHRVYFKGIALAGAGSFETPLGQMPLDLLGCAAIADLPFVSTRPDAHAQEHSLEVHVPFLQRALPHVGFVPLLVGDSSAQEVEHIMQRLWADSSTVFVISTDLSHFHPYDEAQAIDEASCAKILALDPHLHPDEACGATPVNGALVVARERAMRITQLERLNSGDTAGNTPEGRQRVVGYASFALHETASTSSIAIDSRASYADSVWANGRFGIHHTVSQPSAAPNTLDAAQGQRLVALARQTLRQRMTGEQIEPSETADLQFSGASFVTLTLQGQLRGCIGSLQAHRPLAQDVQANALAAALQDPRFPPLTAQELPQIAVEVSVLTAPQPLHHANESHALWQLRPGIDGLIFEAEVNGQAFRSTYLPQVWEQIPEPRSFLAHLKIKAGLNFDFWSPHIKLSRYSVQKFHEH